MKFKDPLNFTGNVQDLFNIATSTERAENFCMGRWGIKLSCGFSGCMIGNWIVQYQPNNVSLGGGILYVGNFEVRAGFYNLIAERLQISELEFEWLFALNAGSSYNKFADRYLERKEEALARLRKFIYYKLRKRELLGDPTTKEGRQQYERARRIEGNHMISEHALCKV